MTTIPDVLESAEYVVRRARLVRIDEGRARAWAATRGASGFPAPEHPAELTFGGDCDASAHVCLLMDCLNFCFWGDEPWSVEYRGKTWTRTYAMFASVLRAIEHDETWLSAQQWASADEAEVGALFRGTGQIPLRAERRAVLNETGRVLAERFGGRFESIAEQAGRDARALACLLAESFPSFRDVATYDGQPVAFLKRAQLCAADVDRLWRRCGAGGLDGMEKLTAFADYRLPQYLRHVGILVLDPQLTDRIERRDELAAGSAEEVELRAATVWASELIRQALGGAVPVWKIDFLLWKHSHDPEVTSAHHRTRTVYY